MRKEDVLKLPSMPAAGPSGRWVTSMRAWPATASTPRQRFPGHRSILSLGVDGRLEICQLVAYNLIEKGSWIGPGRLHLVSHVNAPVADFLVRKTLAAHHFVADLTLPYGRVLYDYNRAS